MQAIVTKYLGPTNFRPSRIKAKCEAKTVVVSWNYDLGVEDNHWAAAAELVKKMGWTEGMGRMECGGLPDSTGYAFVFCKGDK